MTRQVATRSVCITTIMRSKAFQCGVDDVRRGRLPRFDEWSDINWQWNYERGRQWATAAPCRMPVMIGRNINPKAIYLFVRSNIT
jgi:hypothetical protein